MIAAAWLAAILAAGPPGEGQAAGPSSRDALPRACAYLWPKQSGDGGWHSETYGLMRSGQALTPFLLHALLGAGERCPAPAQGVERALAFLRRHTNEAGLLGVADPDLLEYPHYSTAYALRCFVRAGGPADRALVERMRGRLASAQYGPASGVEETGPAFGGWGFGGPRPGGRVGHMDIAHTRRVLQALRESGVADGALFARSFAFLRLMQRHPSERRPHPVPLTIPSRPARAARFDGGFFFSPVVLDANKGEVLADARGPFHGSYASATCDGLLALLAAGVPRDDERVRSARRWLERHPRLDRPEGVPPGGPQDWGQAIYYYHLAVRAEAYAALGLSGPLHERMVRELAPRQRPDGSFANERNHLMKEDDPLLATALAVIALSARADK